MKRKTLDTIVSVGGLGLAVLLTILGFVLVNRSDFANNYVRDEMRQQDISFPTADKLSQKELDFTKARSNCVVNYAGNQVVNGRQAECYANEYLGAHLTFLATRLNMPQIADLDGHNYTQLGADLSTIRADIKTATANNDPKLPQLQQRLTDVTTLRQKMFEGTMLRNALLTSYGFSVFGETAWTAATVAFLVALVLLVLSVAGFIHAHFTPATKVVGAPEVTYSDEHMGGLVGI